MWTKLDDGLESHPKLLRAAQGIKRPAPYTRALGGYVLALLHANRYLTDGFVPMFVFDQRVPTEDLIALCDAGLLRFDAIAAGYWVHDFTEWNPSADSVKAKLRRDRERKRSQQGYRPDSSESRSGSGGDSTEPPNGSRAPSAKSSSRADPVPPGPPGPESPLPPASGGRGLTRAERKAAARGAGPTPATWRDRCADLGHTPPCSTPTACELRQDRERQEVTR